MRRAASRPGIHRVACVYRLDGRAILTAILMASERSMILVVGNTKGGVGKTTLAINLAIARALSGRDVLLVDGDEQGTAISFTELRTEQLGAAGYTAVALHGAALRTQTRQLAPKYSDVVIDVGGRDTGSLRAALTVADTLLIPVQPRSFDLWAIDNIAALVKEAREINERLRAIIILNAADAQGSDNDAAAESLGEADGLEYLPLPVGRRKAFPNAAALGRSVLEQSPRDQKAVQELAALTKAVFV
jgi:chromosome partitioning protein